MNNLLEKINDVGNTNHKTVFLLYPDGFEWDVAKNVVDCFNNSRLKLERVIEIFVRWNVL